MRIAQNIKDFSMENTAKEWLSPTDINTEFGISISTQNKLRMKKAIPYSKIGQKIFYSRDEINKWLSEAKVG